MKLIPIFILCMMLIITGQAVNTANRRYETLVVCSYAHYRQDGTSEQACGDVQDKYNTEFLCSQDANCWVETK